MNKFRVTKKPLVRNVQVERIDVPLDDRDCSAWYEDDLVKSILSVGLLEPIGVRRHPQREGRYLLIYGRRRLAVFQLLQERRIPVMLHEVDDVGAELIAIEENLNREHLSCSDQRHSQIRARYLSGYLDYKGHVQERIRAGLPTRLPSPPDVPDRVEVPSPPTIPARVKALPPPEEWWDFDRKVSG